MEKIKVFYNSLSQTGKMLFFGAMASTLVMVLDLAVVGPILSHIKVVDGEIEAKSQAIRRDQRILSFKERILREYHHYESYVDSEDKSQEEIITGLLKKLETVATRNEIKIANVMPGELEDKPIYKIYKTSLEFEGDLAKVLFFMNQLEESDNLFKITRYDLIPKSKTGTVMKCSMDISRVLITAEDISGLTEGMDFAAEEPPPEMPAETGPDFEEVDLTREVADENG